MEPDARLLPGIHLVTAAGPDLAERYVELGLRVGRHHPDLVDSYYGPPALQRRVIAEPVLEIARLRDDCRRCVADLDAGADPAISGQRRRWLRSQLVGLETTIRSIGGESIPYEDEVRESYGVVARRVDEADLADAQRRLGDALAGTGPLRERVDAFRDRHAIPTEKLRPLIDALSEDFRERTARQFGLPEGERVRFELVSDRPWSGFNYYEGELSSLVAINTDLPVLSSSIGHLIAHEAYPGHHTEATRKEAGLVRGRGQVEESIKMIGTPSCAIAEGLADLGIEVLLGDDRLEIVGEHARSLGVTYDTEAIAALGHFGEMSSKARGNVALMIHADGASHAEAAAYAVRWLLLDPARAAKAVEFTTDPTWRAYGFCYSEGLELCRTFVDGDPSRFERLITEQLTPPDLVAA